MQLDKVTFPSTATRKKKTAKILNKDKTKQTLPLPLSDRKLSLGTGTLQCFSINSSAYVWMNSLTDSVLRLPYAILHSDRAFVFNNTMFL